MSDLIDDPAPGQNAHEFTVSEISGAVRRVIEGEFGRVRVKGEVGRVNLHRSGHLYLDLKDDRAVLASVCWRGQVSRLPVMPEEGMEVVATGKLTTFPGQSKYQLIIDDIRPAGVGALMAMLEKRKKALAAEGLFDASRKQALPYLPEVIGVITSPTGAVIRDILHRLSDRFPRHVIVWPVAVQGDACAPQVAAAIRGFNALGPGGAVPRPDLIIVARGGGSIEDLWGFNEEAVVRAAADSRIPLISAVGHETDTTLIDLAADQRAPTPTAAAELAVPVRRELLARVVELRGRMATGASARLSRMAQRVQDLGRGLGPPARLTMNARQRFDLVSADLPRALGRSVTARRLRLERVGSVRPALLASQTTRAGAEVARLGERLTPALRRSLASARDRLARLVLRPEARARAIGLARERVAALRQRADDAGRDRIGAAGERLAALERLRQTMGYRETLKRGYAVVRGDGAVVTTSVAADAAREVEIEFQDGRTTLSGPRPRGRKVSDEPDQGTLF